MCPKSVLKVPGTFWDTCVVTCVVLGLGTFGTLSDPIVTPIVSPRFINNFHLYTPRPPKPVNTSNTSVVPDRNP